MYGIVYISIPIWLLVKIGILDWHETYKLTFNLLFYRLVENGKQKCHKYWDDECELSVVKSGREIRVKVLDVAMLEDGLIRRTMEIKPLDAEKVSSPCFVNHYYISLKIAQT